MMRRATFLLNLVVTMIQGGPKRITTRFVQGGPERITTRFVMLRVEFLIHLVQMRAHGPPIHWHSLTNSTNGITLAPSTAPPGAAIIPPARKLSWSLVIARVVILMVGGGSWSLVTARVVILMVAKGMMTEMMVGGGMMTEMMVTKVVAMPSQAFDPPSFCLLQRQVWAWRVARYAMR